MSEERERERAQPRVKGAPTRCPYCHDDCPAEVAHLVCRGCLARHHASCWADAGSRCASCGGTAHLEAAGPPPPAPAAATPTPAPPPARAGASPRAEAVRDVLDDLRGGASGSPSLARPGRAFEHAAAAWGVALAGLQALAWGGAELAVASPPVLIGVTAWAFAYAALRRGWEARRPRLGPLSPLDHFGVAYAVQQLLLLAVVGAAAGTLGGAGAGAGACAVVAACYAFFRWELDRGGDP